MESVLQFFYANKEAIFIIALTIFLGLEVISNVPSVLHTPLMSGANAISGVIIIGGIILVGHADLENLSAGSNLLNLVLVNKANDSINIRSFVFTGDDNKWTG